VDPRNLPERHPDTQALVVESFTLTLEIHRALGRELDIRQTEAFNRAIRQARVETEELRQTFAVTVNGAMVEE